MKLTVLEHQKIYIKDTRNISKYEISKEDEEALRLVDIKNGGVFKWGYRYVTPQQWIGVINLPGLSLEILPKISSEDNILSIKNTILLMLRVANNIPIKENIDSDVDFKRYGLIEVLISNFIRKVRYYIREGLISSYNKTINNIHTVKGAIDFTKQMNINLMNPTRFVCKYSTLDDNNIINQHMKMTILQMIKISTSSTNIKELKSILLHFNTISIPFNSRQRKLNIPISKLNVRIKKIIEYCNLFLDGFSVSLNYGKHSVSSMIFDMNKLFEMFIYKSYKKIYKSNVNYQSNQDYLLKSKNGLKKRTKLIPDILINIDNKSKVVIDTKWKNKGSFVQSTDVHQMNAYVSAIPGVDAAILILPKTSSSKEKEDDYMFLHSNMKKELRIRYVDLSLIIDDIAFTNHLKSLLT